MPLIEYGLAYGANYERLVAAKRKYVPTNLFRLNQKAATLKDSQRP